MSAGAEVSEGMCETGGSASKGAWREATASCRVTSPQGCLKFFMTRQLASPELVCSRESTSPAYNVLHRLLSGVTHHHSAIASIRSESLSRAHMQGEEN